MNLKYIKIILILFLVCSLIFEVDAGEEEVKKKKSKRKKKSKNPARVKAKAKHHHHHNKKKKQKLFPSTTTFLPALIPTTASGLILSSAALKISTPVGHGAMDGLTTLPSRSDSTRAERTNSTESDYDMETMMGFIMDMIMGDYDEAYEDVLPSTRFVTLAVEENTEASSSDDEEEGMEEENIQVDSGPKRKDSNNVIKKIDYEEETTLERTTIEIVVGATTDDQNDTDDPEEIISMKEDDSEKKSEKKTIEMDSCDFDNVRNLIVKYKADGTKQMALQKLTSRLSPDMPSEQKLAIANETFIELGLPPLKPCNPATSLDAKMEETEISETDTCNFGGKITSPEEGLKLVKKMQDRNMLPQGTTHKALTGDIPIPQLKRMMLEAAVEQTVEEPKVEGAVQSQELNQLMALIEAGYLPPDTLKKFALGEITEEWLRKNLSQNRDLIMSRLPLPLSKLIESGEMPPDIEAAIFSGSHNKTELAKMFVRDDDFIKKLLPQKMLDMLQDRPVPMELKLLIISGKNESVIREEVEANDELLQQMMSPSTYFFFNLFKVQRNRTINVVISVVVVVVLTFIMVSLGCTMTIDKIIEHAKKPKGVVIALFAQFVIMPASAFGLTQAFNLDMYSAIAVLICGCCPGGNLSNMLAYSLSGDMNLSILMTTCSSILGLGLMPLSIFLYSRFIIPLDSGAVVPFDKIIINIALTIIPVCVGIAIRHFRPQWVTFVMRTGAVVLVVCSVTVAVLAGVMLGDAFFIYFPLPVLACCAILPMAGYILGYFFAFIARENPKCRRTICVETGCQNVQLCGTVLKLAFDPVLVGVLYLMPLVYMLFQVIEAFLIIFIFRLYNRLRYGKSEELKEEKTDDEKKKSDLESGSDLEKKSVEKNEQEHLLQENKEKESSKMTATGEGKSDQNTDNNGQLTEIWPLEGNPTPAYLDSFKTAGTENFV
ncbi:unnamed protein product [Clavelina lepadiformis]|uniref:Uncharacterized protein n=1 Tax=Clavelina lepadiformis TaxID=159417 RepID=A0ABP0F149_CLALP